MTKAERKEAQRWAKVCTIVLESMTGMKGGKPDGVPLTKQVHFPLELEDRIQYLYMVATTTRRPYYAVILDAERAVDYYVKEGWKQNEPWYYSHSWYNGYEVEDQI